jgi:general secretion pathway protein K
MPKYTTKRRLVRHPACKQSEKGIALIGVLWLVALIGILALGVSLLAKSDRLSAQAAADSARAEGLADAGVFLTVHQLCDRRTVNQVPIDGQEKTLTIDGQRVTAAVQDEFGKIDINFAPDNLLESLFVSAGLSGDESKAITDSIDANRNAASQQIADALEINPIDQTQPISLTFPFRTLEELKSIPGISDEIFQQVRPALTVYSQQPNVQTSTAPPAVLRALPGMDAGKIQQILSARQNNPVTAGSAALTQTAPTTISGRVFTILSKAQSGTAVFPRRAVVLITGDIHRPYKILEWTMDDSQD